MQNNASGLRKINGGAEHGRVWDQNHIESGMSWSDFSSATTQTFRNAVEMLSLKIVKSLDEVAFRQMPNPLNRIGLSW